MDTLARRAFVWQLLGGLVATLVLIASLAELLWWSLYLSDRTNVTPFWTWAVHLFAAIAIAALVAYHSQRHRRNAAFAAAAFNGDLEPKGLEFRLGPIPVKIQWYFFLIAAVLGFDADGLIRCLLFVVLATLAVLGHELGHAAAATRSRQTDVAIELHALGGVTTYNSESVTRAQSLGIALAGPAAGIFLGVVAVAVGQLYPPMMEAPIFRDVLFVTFGWSLLNLVPVWPLDGSALIWPIVRQELRLFQLSIGVSCVAIVACAYAGQRSLLFFFICLLIANASALPSVQRALTWLNARLG